jgi:hypothetical protein
VEDAKGDVRGGVPGFIPSDYVIQKVTTPSFEPERGGAEEQGRISQAPIPLPFSHMHYTSNFEELSTSRRVILHVPFSPIPPSSFPEHECKGDRLSFPTCIILKKMRTCQEEGKDLKTLPLTCARSSSSSPHNPLP